MQPGVETEVRSSHGEAAAAAADGGGDEARRRRQPVEAAAALGDGAGMEEVLHPKTAVWEEENSWYGGLPTS